MVVETRRSVALISLGCPKNLVDSEGLVSRLLSGGIDVVTDPHGADVAIVNTCGFLGASRDESIATIAKVAELKKSGLKGLVVTGCMVGHYADMVRTAVPAVDRLVDFADYRRITDFVDEFAPPPGGQKSLFLKPGKFIQARLTPAHYAYLKISEGCDHVCTFCVIPKIRGAMRSVPIEELVERAERLAELGAREINVVAQDSTLYGVDIYGKRRLVDLLAALAKIKKLAWIRLLYAYPTEVDDALLDLLGQGSKVLPYMDVPLQHTHGRILKAMSRKSSEECVEQLLERFRHRVPGGTLRTTFIVGFPGETEAEFDHLMRFVERHEIERLGVFKYSPEPGSAAFDLADPVPEPEKDARLDRVMRLQQTIAEKKQRAWIGKKIRVLIDDPEEKDGRAVGRSAGDAPEIDGKVYVTGKKLAAGAMPFVTIDSATAYDLFGRVEDERA